MALAGFTVGEAEGLRRAMSRKRSEEAIEAFRAAVRRGRARNGVDGELAEHGLRQARGLLRLRLPEVALGRVRAARLPVGVAAPPLPGRVPLRAPERAADGLLPAGQPRPRRPAAGGGGPPAGRQPQRGAAARGEDGAVRIGLGTSGRWARRRPRRSSPSGRRTAIRLVADLARRAPLDARELEALVAQRRLRPLRQAARPALASSGSSPARRPSSAEHKQLALPLEPTAADSRAPATRPTGSGCSPTTGRRASRSTCTR